MYLPDDRFSTVVAFVEGYNAAFDGEPLSGFPEYVAKEVLGRHSSLHWSYIVASTRVSEIFDEGTGLDEIPAHLESDLTNTLLDLLESYEESLGA